MNFEELLYLLPYLLSLSLSIAIFAYSWRHRQVRGVSEYALYMGAVTLTIFGFIIELISPNLYSKILWDQFQWITQTAYLAAYLRFSLSYAQVRLLHPRRTWWIWFVIPFVFMILMITDGFHHLIYPNPHLSTDYPFPELRYDHTTIIYIYGVYLYVTTLYGFYLLLRRAFQQRGVYRQQYITIAVGFLIPVILSIFAFTDIKISPQRDNSPFALILGSTIVAWGLFRYKVFNLAPIAREQIVDNMNDPVIVLDGQNRVIDINQAALTMIGKSESEVMGHTFHESFAGWPIVAELLANPGEQRREVSTRSKGEIVFYEISISQIRNKRNELLGRILVARDITRHKYLEMSYRALSEELEERVHKRTQESKRIAEQYRTVVEHQSEFIVRWKPDRTRTFVNEAYCRHFGMTFEQAMQSDFLTLIVEADRPAVLGKIARLTAGEVENETEIHRVPMPDGSIGWQEWTDHAIRDAEGNVVEFQSVGRDITERMRAQLALQKSEKTHRLLFETANDAIILLNGDQAVDCNSRALEMFRCQREDIIGKRPMDFSPEFQPDGKTSSEKTLEKVGAVLAGEPQFFEWRHCRLDRTQFDAEISLSLLELEGVSFTQAIVRDVTERKQAEQALRESERKISTLIGNLPGIAYRCQNDSDWTMEFISEGCKELTGYSSSELLGNATVSYGQLVYEEDRDRIWDTVQAGLQAHEPFQMEYRIHSRTGEERYVWERGRAVYDETGNAQSLEGFIMDITARKTSEERLQMSEQRFSKAFKASPIMIAISRLDDAALLEVNQTFEELTGYTREEAIGKSTLELGIWEHVQDRERLIGALVGAGEIRNHEVQFRTKYGTLLTGLVSADLIELDGEKCLLATIQDITERKIAEASILRLNRLYATISQINQTIVHERDKASLLRKICSVAIEQGQFRMAWVGLLDKATGLVEPAAFAGEELGYLAGLAINYEDPSLQESPVNTAIREGRCIVCQDIEKDPGTIYWRDAALKRGYRSTAVVPLRELGSVVGILAVYSAVVEGFNAEDEQLLEQIGWDVSFALDSISAEQQRQIAEQNLAIAYDTTLEGWSRALELRDKETEGHSRRVTESTLIVAGAMGFSEAELLDLRYGSLLHDIGKMAIPDEILRKNGPLTPEERLLVQNHPTTAYELLKMIPYLERALEIPYCHHEKWDGSGYPRGLSGEAIPLSARIFAVVDVWDALSSDRPYRQGWPQQKVVEYLRSESGKHFDPQVVEVFLQLLDEGKI